ncbi:DUF4350 domain-containing protein [Stutzerimonas tarimensis]|uniref:DUF4350 domain-containing protein n=1 Tax=Stutzerimonas tarimensis TaxID=1507735 RepID=A0ABV7T224_9GAMM
MNRARWPLLFAALLALTIAFYVAGQLERQQVTLDHGPSPEAQADPYLAAQLFLKGLGSSVVRSEDLRLAALPGSGHTLMLLADRGGWSAGQTRRVLEWAQAGGHLLFVAERLWDEARGQSGDLLLDALGLQQHETGDEHPALQSPMVPAPHPELTRLFVENESAPAYLAFDTRYHLYDPEQKAHARANSSHATHMLQLRHGEGLVTVLTDAWLWQNSRIGQLDHAWLLWYLSQDRDVTLVFRESQLSLVKLVTEHFTEAATSLALLLALWLWRASRRRGPLLPATPSSRRQLLTHLRASADFRMRRLGRHRLIEDLQADILQQVQRHHPGISSLEPVERSELLARLSLQPVAQVDQAMQTPDARLSLADFTEQVGLLQSLRNAL